MKIELSRLSISILSWLASQIIDESKQENHPMVKDHALLKALETTYEGYFAVYGKKNYSGKGKLVAKASVLRDEAFVGLKFCIYGQTKVSSNSLLSDATDQYKIFKHLGLDLNRQNYSSKAALFSKLIEMLDLPENNAKIKNLHLTELFEILKTTHLNFDKLYFEQIDANAKLRGMETASALRSDLEIAIRNYLNLITAMKQFEGWRNLHAVLNEYVKSARNSHRKRKDKSEENGNNSEVSMDFTTGKNE